PVARVSRKSTLPYLKTTVSSASNQKRRGLQIGTKPETEAGAGPAMCRFRARDRHKVPRAAHPEQAQVWTRPRRARLRARLNQTTPTVNSVFPPLLEIVNHNFPAMRFKNLLHELQMQ